MILVVYHSTRAYKLYNLVSKEIKFSRDVVVMENEAWDWKNSDKSTDATPVSFETGLDIETEAVEVPNTTEESYDEEPPGLVRTQRHMQLPRRFNDCEIVADDEVVNEGELIHFTILADSKPIDYKVALKKKAWKDAMVEELNSIEKNKTCELTDLPPNKKVVGVKWVFKLKLNPEGKVVKHKPTLVDKGFLQKHGFDFTEMFSPVARHETIRLVIAIACSNS